MSLSPTKNKGIENEGFIVSVNDPELAITSIDDIPASQWVLDRARELGPDVAALVTPEDASVQIEIKSNVYESMLAAGQEVLDIRAALDDRLASKGARILFKPVLAKPFQVLAPVSFDPDCSPEEQPHQLKLFKRWEKMDGPSLVACAATGSIQFNDSEIFEGTVDLSQRLEIAWRVHNVMSREAAEMLAVNDGNLRDASGRTRIEAARTLIFTDAQGKNGEKGSRASFFAAGYTVNDLVRPPHFTTREDFIRWACAMSDVGRFEDTRAKGEWSHTIKVRRPVSNDMSGPWIIETRSDDAQDTIRDIMNRWTMHRSRMEQALRIRDEVLSRQP